jgi:hypothetical protein
MSKIANIYEDVLPNIKIVNNMSLMTCSERIILYNYVRGLYIVKGDGEEINFDDTNKINKKSDLYSLLSYIKILEINPHHFSMLTNNPYTTMADNIVIWNACYPIRMDRNNKKIMCAK